MYDCSKFVVSSRDPWYHESLPSVGHGGEAEFIDDGDTNLLYISPEHETRTEPLYL